MTKIEAKEELQQYIFLKRQVERFKRKVRELECAATNATQNFSSVSVQGGKSNELIESYLDAKVEYDRMERLALDKVIEVERKIERLENPYSEILKLKYIDGKSFEQIAPVVNYCYRYVKRLHKIGLERYCEVENERK